MSQNKDQKPGIRLTREDLEKLPVEERIKLFGHDPIEKEGGFISKWSVIMALAIAGLLIGVTAFVIERYFHSDNEPLIVLNEFSIPNEDGFSGVASFENMKNAWLAGRHSQFTDLANTFLNDPDLHIETDSIKEVQLYKIRAFLLTGEFVAAANLANILHGRYGDDLVFLSDLYYYRGHIIAKRENLKAAFGAFSESCALTGRYSEESCRLMRQIQRMNRPLW